MAGGGAIGSAGVLVAGVGMAHWVSGIYKHADPGHTFPLAEACSELCWVLGLREVEPRSVGDEEGIGYSRWC